MLIQYDGAEGIRLLRNGKLITVKLKPFRFSVQWSICVNI